MISLTNVLLPPVFSGLLETCTICRTSKWITISSVNPNPEVQKNRRRKHRNDICDNNHPKFVRLIGSIIFYKRKLFYILQSHSLDSYLNYRIYILLNPQLFSNLHINF